MRACYALQEELIMWCILLYVFPIFPRCVLYVSLTYIAYVR